MPRSRSNNWGTAVDIIGSSCRVQQMQLPPSLEQKMAAFSMCYLSVCLQLGACMDNLADTVDQRTIFSHTYAKNAWVL